MIRVAQMIDSLYVGGAEKLQVTFAEAVQGRDVELTVISLKDSKTVIRDELEALGVSLFVFPAQKLLQMNRIRHLYRFLARERFDVLHTHLGYANVLGSILGRFAGIPVVASLHNTKIREDSDHPLLAALETVGLRYGATRIVAVGHAVAQAQKGRFKGKVVEVIPNAVPVVGALSAGERRDVRTEIAGGADCHVLISVGRLEPQKGFGDLLTAFVEVHRTHPAARLAIAGIGSLRDELDAQIEALNLQDSVKMLGMRHDVPRLLAASDLFVSSSHWEGLPVSVLEAMSAGLPIVATNVGDIPQVIQDGHSGLIVSPEEPEELAQAICTLLDDPERRDAYGAAAQTHIHQTYGPAAWVDRLLALYEEVRLPRQTAGLVGA